MALKKTEVDVKHIVLRGSGDQLNNYVLGMKLQGWTLTEVRFVTLDPYNNELTMFYLWTKGMELFEDEKSK